MINFIKNFAKLREKIFFTKDELLELWIKEDIISELLKEWALRDLTHGIFTLSKDDVYIDDDIKFLLPKKIYEKSYITWESAFDYYKVIYWFFHPCVATGKKNEIFSADNLIVHLYKSSLEEPETIDIIINSSNKWVGSILTRMNVKMATLEQALVDYFYNQYEIATNFSKNHELVKLQLITKLNKEKLKELANKTWDDKTITSIYNLTQWLEND